MNDLPWMWYLNRSTGFVILGLFTMTTALGVLATSGRAGRGLPRFVTQSFHRNVALLSVVMLGAHVVTAVADTYVDIRWWQALVPYVGSTYEPVWLALGTVALDLILVITVTSLFRDRLGHRAWRSIHLLAYVGWGLSVGHALGIGTDMGQTTWAVPVTAGAIGVVLAAVVYRLGHLIVERTHLAARP